MSCRDMVEALIAGKRNPQVLADLAWGKMRAKRKAPAGTAGMPVPPWAAFAVASLRPDLLTYRETQVARLSLREPQAWRSPAGLGSAAGGRKRTPSTS
jgi:hypothetical protein